MAVPYFGSGDSLQPRMQIMQSMLTKQKTAPATTNLFTVQFSTPPVFRDYATETDFKSLEKGDTANLLNYYAFLLYLQMHYLYH